MSDGTKNCRAQSDEVSVTGLVNAINSAAEQIHAEINSIESEFADVLKPRLEDTSEGDKATEKGSAALVEELQLIRLSVVGAYERLEEVRRRNAL